jgi:hypothetical protein
MERPWRRRGLSGLVAAVALLTSCNSSLKPSDLVIENFITAVTDGTGSIAAVLQRGTPPTASGGPSNTITGFAAMVTGGSAQQTITGSAAFTTVIVAMPGVDNYYELTIPSTGSTNFLLRAATNLPGMNLAMNYAVGSGGALGAYSAGAVRVIAVGTGDVQVSASWSDTSDVDLHVIDPSGEEIYFGNSTSASGGELDLDSNAACSRDVDPDNPTGPQVHLNNENIVWPSGAAPTGTYTVRLAYWSACSVSAPTNWVVTVATAGGTPQIFTGQFTGPGTGGGAGSGVLITTFTF